MPDVKPEDLSDQPEASREMKQMLVDLVKADIAKKDAEIAAWLAKFRAERSRAHQAEARADRAEAALRKATERLAALDAQLMRLARDHRRDEAIVSVVNGNRTDVWVREMRAYFTDSEARHA